MKKSFSSEPMALSQTPRGVLDLGRALVEELGLDPGVDTLSRWMAHYIVELIEEAESAKVEERPNKLAKCADAILKLWEHRRQLPSGKRPFEDLEPVLRVLETLDPNDDTPRYFRRERMLADKTKENAKTRKWLDLADGLDYSAKVLIRYCITCAAQTALDKSKDWVVLAEALGLEDDVDLLIIRLITDESDLMKVSEPDEKARALLQGRIDRLDEFRKMAEALALDLRRQLRLAGVPNGDSHVL
ncbi:MAG: AVAST type 3 anti-phage protein Avs3b [Syntrophobacteraceae bacterium]